MYLPDGSLAEAETIPYQPEGESSHQYIDGILHHDVGLVLERGAPRLQQSEAGLYGEHHEDVAEDPGRVVVLPVADVLVDGDLGGGVGGQGQQGLVIIRLRLLVNILVHIFL